MENSITSALKFLNQLHIATLKENKTNQRFPFYNTFHKTRVPDISLKNTFLPEDINKTLVYYKNIGIFPHPILLKVISNNAKFQLLDISTNDDEWLKSIWTELKIKLTLEKCDCFKDECLFYTYGDLLEAHDREMYNLSDAVLVKIFERAMNFYEPDKDLRPKEKLKNKMGKIPVSKIKLTHFDVALFAFLSEHFTKRSEKFSGHTYHPNRNITAHGLDSKELVIFDSINCVLLAHWIIEMINKITTAD